jgi:hypothetical protein
MLRNIGLNVVPCTGTLLLFPRYTILKDQMAETMGGDQTKPQMKPVIVRFDDCSVDRLEYLKADFGAVVATCEQLGRGSAAAVTP